MIKTRITEMFGVETPIVMGGMTGVGHARLVAAVANAGALGFIVAHHSSNKQELLEEIELCRSLTDKPFGVNLTLLPSLNKIPYDEYREAIIESGIKIVETAGRNPTDHLPAFKAAGVKVIHKCTSVRHAVTAARHGVDIISIDGFECAGHPGEDDVGLIVLLPATVDALGDVPVIASGGMADGRSLAAALMLGAEGVNMGTRFMATQECAIHENVKKKIVENTERDTLLTNRTLRNTSRVARNAVSEEVVAIQQDSTKTIEDVRHLVAGVRGRTNVMGAGDTDGGIWTVGQSQGLIHDIPTCQDMVAAIMRQAEQVLTKNAQRVVVSA
ncbi:MAG: nitronate monooxygenase family protein [Phenylobacterium sp.]|uniref:NAD(P)H-dependent flavin oxidoreductase n=1 Tax=Phenylobacterium sp. TaxID=1871053 RepID=UPI00271F719E|nr:nitronate monooxygenase family protein [Phenylobacterium sp.]MDO8910889.1 nitronate monooxygenase family protein [Phenylobacterium sp.]MDP3099331.1 nitronate monooxygenase family protein [Phenylobacterium sp.]